MAKYIFVTGGVVSSLGKGIAAASIGCLLESRGLKVTLQKFDPYLNVDPGTMSPFQHGEVFVTDDGAETDLDLGHYERFTHAPLTQANNLTSGRIYESIIQRERRGDYLGKTVQVIPHVTNEIKAGIAKVSQGVDVVIVEIGGTVGDIESLPFLEAIRQVRHEKGRDNVVFVHVTLVPWIAAAHELKTKPTQHSVKELRAIGIQPDILLCRTEREIPADMKEKIALFCDVEADSVIAASDVKSVYEVPVGFAEQGVDEIILRQLKLETAPRDLSKWKGMLHRLMNPVDEVDIGVVGKYVEYEDSYKSLKESLLIAGLAHQLKVNIRWIEAEELHWPECSEKLKAYAKLNNYHVDTLAYYLRKLDSIQDGDGTLLDHTAVLYGGGMSDANVHNNYNVPVVIVGGKTLQLKGDRHHKFEKGTPLANLMLGVLDRFGVHADKFGDSTSEIDLLTV